MGQTPAKVAAPPAANIEDRLKQRQTLMEQKRHCLLANVTEPPTDAVYCPRVFDGIACWEAAPANTTSSQPCPDYFQGFYGHNRMERQCMADGNWFFNNEHNTTWTNFTGCHLPPSLPPDDYLAMIKYTDNNLIKVWTPVIKNIRTVGYGISLTSLLIAMVIFCSIRKLRSCPRTKLHMHLFASFILKAGMLFAKDVVSHHWLGPEYSGSWVCKMVGSFAEYFTMANYSWVTMEGLYLFCLIYLALFSDHSSITPYVLLGWGFPIGFVVPWVVVRALMESQNDLCWRINSSNSIFWIIRAPTIFLILVNAVLFVCIVLILMQKLNSSISVETRRYRYRKLARSTLVLIPLFGFHYVVFVGFSAFMNVNQILELIWLFADQLFASFQGFFVAILYCFMNSEVKLEVRKHWAAWRYSRASATSRGYRFNNGKSYRSTGRSSVQSTTLMDKPSEMAGQSRTPSPLVAAVTGRSSPRQSCMAQPIKEDAWEESREPTSDILLLPLQTADGGGGDTSKPPINALLVCYNGDSGGSVHIQISPGAAAPAAGAGDAA